MLWLDLTGPPATSSASARHKRYSSVFQYTTAEVRIHLIRVFLSTLFAPRVFPEGRMSVHLGEKWAARVINKTEMALILEMRESCCMIPFQRKN